MEDIEKLIDELQLYNHLTPEDIPDLDLYMDQVIQLFEKKYQDTKRNDDEKVLTKTMINNYAKGKLFFPITNKKYSQAHVLLISLIYQLKGALSISDIKTVLDKLNQKVVDDGFDLDSFYRSYIHLSEQNADTFLNHTKSSAKAVEDITNNLDEEDLAYLEKVLLITSFVNMSNFYRRAAEKLVDEIAEKKNNK
ncbi:protein of unknown function [Salinibacillus kushneri]|uniref:DUF1836 domain-containing protein n=1 Tax=Salinibacillus kushneri TaxID=237682 RepID=A0A1H9YFU8_9BACI|nr:DUF1836 domain-containing protein [Salinibacillus kushneri]SES67900.1 protein of unknown function [Salinibacillus kushneri]